ncbi:MAG: inositol monophosphatase [Myxococcales bacterium]|nr:inositol monophosphatase [Myxococcales bacterium]MCB9532396.1 inositol monophosphatase [Myxococcales bacterium]
MTLRSVERSELAREAVAAARAGGEVARRGFAAAKSAAHHKGAVDLVTETDLAVEALIRERLTATTGLPVVGEERGRSGAEGGATWIVDPIDGTTNFAHRHPHFAVSIGLVDAADEPVLGVVYAPFADELFWTDGDGAWLGDAALAPIRPVRLSESLLATGFPYDRQTNPDNNTDLATAFLMRTHGVRRMGAAALDLAWVAAGRIDGFWEPRLKPWDVAAGVALVRAVGGEVVDYRGERHRIDAPSLVAAHGALLAEMLDVVREVRYRWEVDLPTTRATDE